MSKSDLVRSEMVKAMKEKNKDRKDALSMLLSALKNKAIDKRSDLTEEEENEVVLKELKQTQESLDTTPPDRTELIEQWKLRIAVYQEFAPQFLSEDEIREIIAQVLKDLDIAEPSGKDKGRIMKELMPKVKGKSDGKVVNNLVSALFN